ncbi:MAG: ParB N-terminal domain-containing protein [Pseudomonadota bacterium]
MSKKRRVFDIDFDDATELETKSVPAGTDAPLRRGPMAAAITENADALQDRSAAEAAIRAENDKLAHEFVALKKAGGIVKRIRIDQIHTDKLIRDRSPVRDADIDELKASIQAVGLSNPIQVEERADGQYELVQGWRRLTAFRELHRDTLKDAFLTVPAGIVAKGESLERLYQRMVDENLMRRDISFSEMAQLALSYARDSETSTANARDAVDILFASAGRQKRAYIKNFTVLLLHLDGVLAHPYAVPRSLGLQLVKRMDEDPQAAARLRAYLADPEGRDEAQELDILRAFVSEKPVKRKPAARRKSSAKTTIKLTRPRGDTVRCTASDGRLEVTVNHDFSAHDARKLEEAITRMLDHLDR